MNEPGPLGPALIHVAFAEHARARPEATAIAANGEKISYRTLEAAANSYAIELLDLGVGPGDVVPLLLPRSPLLVAVQLGVLKCGAAYANLDHRWPQERLATILRQISPAVVVGVNEVEANGRVWHAPLRESISAAASRGRTFDGILVDATAPATIFFTSGTTGGPKGVVTPHQAATRLFDGSFAEFGFGHAMPQAAPLPWDMYAFEVWGQLTTGGTSVLVDGDHLMPSTLRDFVRTSGVDTLWITASLFNIFVDEDLDCFDGLTHVLTGGERLSPRHVRAFLHRHPSIALTNGYGPAENCMLTTTHVLRLEDCDLPNGVPVGVRVPGTTVFVLNDASSVCPAGEMGEICIAGSGLANGYLGNPELTAEKFPTIDINGAPVRIYRTGDLGWIDDVGVLHYRGRHDRQVKIRGHRVELAEIEESGRSAPGVRECAALAITTDEGEVARLALMYLAEPGQSDRLDGDDTDPLRVREHLRRLLPAYLVPSVVQVLSSFPVTANGKLDRTALLAVARRSPRSRSRVGRRRAAELLSANSPDRK